MCVTVCATNMCVTISYVCVCVCVCVCVLYRPDALPTIPSFNFLFAPTKEEKEEGEDEKQFLVSTFTFVLFFTFAFFGKKKEGEDIKVNMSFVGY